MRRHCINEVKRKNIGSMFQVAKPIEEQGWKGGWTGHESLSI